VTISERSAALLAELRAGMAQEQQDERTADQLVDDAIKRVHRGFFGIAPDEGGPDQSTGPFRKWASDRRAEVLLRQVDPTTFRLSQPFRYQKGGVSFEIPEDDVTDLASVPRFLTWLVPRYGRHTLAALLHDHLQDDTSVSSERADEIFRDAMGDTGVPLSRRWVMWAAVALRTQWNRGGLRQLRALVWVAVFGVIALGLWPFVVGQLAADGLGGLPLAAGALGVAVVAPVLLSWVWGRLWPIGALGGVSLLLFALPVVLVVVALALYAAVEWLVERLFVGGAQRHPVLARNM
jgi:hypothetical protein